MTKRHHEPGGQPDALCRHGVRALPLQYKAAAVDTHDHVRGVSALTIPLMPRAKVARAAAAAAAAADVPSEGKIIFKCFA